MAKHIERVSIRPGVNLLSVLPHLNYKHWFALGEFVDNAIQSYLANRSALRKVEGRKFVLSVDIDIDIERGEIIVRDNAAGISDLVYERAFRPAEAPADVKGLSEFGMGMKSAAAWLAPRWTVRSTALGETVAREVSFDIKQIIAQTAEELDVVSTPARADEHFTEIVLRDVRKMPQKRTIAKIQEHLASLYRRFLEGGELRLSLNGAPLMYEQPEILAAPHWRDPAAEPTLWRKEVAFDLEGGRRAEGWVAIRARGSTTRAGLALLRRGRVIEGSADEPYRPREVFGASNSFTYQRLFGEIELTNFDVSHTKDGIRWDEAEPEFTEKLKAALSAPDLPLLDQALNWRSSDSSVRSAVAPVAHELVALSSLPAAPTDAPRIAEATKIRRKPVKIERGADWRALSLDIAGVAWQVEISLDHDEGATEWIEVAAASVGEFDGRKLQVKIAMAHPFSRQFLGNGDGSIEAVLRLAAGLAIAEAIANKDGVRFATRIRTSLNDLLLLGLAD